MTPKEVDSITGLKNAKDAYYIKMKGLVGRHKQHMAVDGTKRYELINHS